MITNTQSKAFTLVEMMVLVAVLGILISITAFGYRGWQEGLAQRSAKSDLTMLAAAMENQKNFGSGYSTSIPSSFVPSDDIDLTYVGGNEASYCVEARSSKFSSIVFSIIAGSAGPQAGACGSAYALAQPYPSVSSITTSSFVISWNAVAGATSYEVNYGTSTPSTTASCTSSPCTLTGLSSNTEYRFTVKARSDYNEKSSIEYTTRTSVPTPGTPSPSAVASSSSAINVTWSATSNATSYAVRYGTSSPTVVASCTSSPCAITGLAASTVYYINVSATNSAGTSTSSTINATTQSSGPVCGGTSYRLVRSGLPAAHGNFYTLSYTRTATGTNTNFPGQYQTPGTGTYTFDQTITGLCTASGYSYTLFYRDQLGSILTTFPGTFTTP